MPTYDYQCRSCGSVTEVIHSMLEDGPTVCERCGGELRRVLYPTGIIFKGSGFFRTDSRASSSSGSAASPTPSGDGKKSDSAGTSAGTSTGTGDASGSTATSGTTGSPSSD